MDEDQRKMAREHFAQSWETLIFQDLTDDELETLGMVFGQIQALPPHLATEQVAYNFGFIAAAQVARRRSAEPTAEEPPADPDAVPDFFRGGHLGEHEFIPLEGDPDGTRCGFSTRVEGLDHPVICELPPVAVPHQKWIKNNAQKPTED